MYITAKQKKKIRKTLPKNFRQLIVEKCAKNGVDITVRQVSMVMDNSIHNNKLIMAVLDSISEILEEQEEMKRYLSEKINF